MELSGFNVNHGFSEAVVRGFRSGFLGPEDYRRLATSDSLEDMRSALEETDYGTFLQDEPVPLMEATISKKCYEKLADEFRYLKAQTVEPLTTFMDFIAREKMIDNVILIIQGAMNRKAPHEMQSKLHPLGHFDGEKVIMAENFDTQGGFEEMYKIVMQDTPIGSYFEEYLEVKRNERMAEGNQQASAGGAAEQDKKLDDEFQHEDLEFMKAALKKFWLEDFYSFVMQLGGTTAEVMGNILSEEADYRVLAVTVNAIGTQSGESKLQSFFKLYPNFGKLYPEGHKLLRNQTEWNESSVKTVFEGYTEYSKMFDEVKGFYEGVGEEAGGGARSHNQHSIEDKIYTANKKKYEYSFEQQYHFGIFYAWVKLREQEIRNLRWIANMISLQQKDEIDNFIVKIFEPRM